MTFAGRKNSKELNDPWAGLSRLGSEGKK